MNSSLKKIDLILKKKSWENFEKIMGYLWKILIKFGNVVEISDDVLRKNTSKLRIKFGKYLSKSYGSFEWNFRKL